MTVNHHAPPLGEVIAERVRIYRERQGLRQEDVAERTADLGHPISRVTLAKIEAGGTRASNASLVDVLVLAVALDVPPPLLFLPIGDAEEVTIAPNLVAHPHVALDWWAGEEPIAALPENFARNVEAWGRNVQPLRMFRGLREREDAAHLAEGRVRTWEEQGRDDLAAEARRELDRKLTVIATWLEAMHAAGLSTPPMPEPWRDRIAELVEEDG